MTKVNPTVAAVALNQLQELIEDYEAPQLLFDGDSEDERYGVAFMFEYYYAPTLVEAIAKAYKAWQEE